MYYLYVPANSVGFLILALSLNYGMEVVIYCYFVNTILDQIINSWPNRKLLEYTYLEQMKDIFPSTALAVIMGACVYSISFLCLNVWITVLLQILLGFFIYLLGSIIFELEAYRQLLDVAKSYFKKKGGREG